MTNVFIHALGSPLSKNVRFVSSFIIFYDIRNTTRDSRWQK